MLEVLHVYWLQSEPNGGDLMAKKSRKKILGYADRKSDGRRKAVITLLLSSDKPVWRRVAELLATPRRRAKATNISKLQRYGREDMVIVVPGKLLGDGSLNKSLKVAAYSFTKRAEEELKKSNSTLLTIEEVFEKHKDQPSTIQIII